MKRSRRDRRRKPKRTRVDIVPLIDIIFLLLAFFMLLTMSMVFQEGISVDLAEAGASESVETENKVVISLEKDGALYWGEESITMDQLSLRLSDRVGGDEQPPRVFVNADREVDHGQIIDVVDRIRASEIEHVIFTVEPTP